MLIPAALPLFASALRNFAPALADHLWQSTAVFVLAWILTLLLRHNRASLRHALWLAASLKFLVPFSALAALLGLLRHASHTTAPAGSVVIAVRSAAQPFLAASTPVSASFPEPIASATSTPAAWPVILVAAVWAAGTLAVVAIWIAHWCAAHRILHAATRATHGRELRLLRRIEASRQTRRTLPLYLCADHCEPGLFGILLPALLWPASLSEHLSDEHIEAILLHELIHAQRHDNLIAAAHMLVQAIFWFHPAVWIIERRLLAERELACDEAVIAGGGSRRAYAQSLIVTSRHAVNMPLAPTAGFTGGGPLNARVTSILRSQRDALTMARKAALAIAVILTIAVPIVIAQTTRKLEFEVASVRQSPPILPERNNDLLTGTTLEGRTFTGGIFSANAPLPGYLDFAYKVDNVPQAIAFDNQMPTWAKGVNYDIEARSDPSATADDVRLMMQSLLADRFALKVHSETKDAPVLALTLLHGTPGPQLHVHTEPTPCVNHAGLQMAPHENSSNGRPVYCKLDMWVNEGRLHFRFINATLSEFTNAMGSFYFLAHGDESNMASYPVADHTGFTGLIDFEIEFVKNEQQAEANHISGPLFDEAFSKQLGLRLTRTTAPVTTLVIDHIEPPKPN